ncbi:hypothetical protein SAMN06298216_0664 [Spirosomataceae bacterium TFI 002]|nr:hypothetical protein SAMN06298216_0664 [Spirosomataceae bacterium TFI 002]
MLGIFIIYWIGKRYYALAYDYEKSPWLYAILGVAIYYVSQFIVGITIGFTLPDLVSNDSGSSFSTISILGVLGGVLVWWVVYELIKRNWEKKYFAEYQNISDDEIEQIGSGI